MNLEHHYQPTVSAIESGHDLSTPPDGALLDHECRARFLHIGIRFQLSDQE